MDHRSHTPTEELSPRTQAALLVLAFVLIPALVYCCCSIGGAAFH